MFLTFLSEVENYIPRRLINGGNKLDIIDQNDIYEGTKKPKDKVTLLSFSKFLI